MPMNNIQKLAGFGQSAWLDNINRSLIGSGRLKDMIDKGLRGMTSNPTIFDKAISQSSDYDVKIQRLSGNGRTTFEIYDDLTISDIQDAADLLKPVYETTAGLDGYVSLEVNPELAMKTKKTIEEGKRLLKKVSRPNLMLKIPATDKGFAAVEELIALGANINVTLIFSLEQYTNSARAFIKGLKRFSDAGGDARKIASVASVFVSRIDTMIDKKLDELSKERLKGIAAVANSKLIYKKYLDIFSGAEFAALKSKGARPQRVLWASTSTKDPAYSDIKYVTELIGKDTVNTLPGNTYEAFLDHGTIKEALTGDIGDAKGALDELRGLGIDIDDICATLLENGVSSFEKSFTSLIASIKTKTEALYNK